MTISCKISQTPTIIQTLKLSPYRKDLCRFEADYTMVELLSPIMWICVYAHVHDMRTHPERKQVGPLTRNICSVVSVQFCAEVISSWAGIELNKNLSCIQKGYLHQGSLSHSTAFIKEGHEPLLVLKYFFEKEAFYNTSQWTKTICGLNESGHWESFTALFWAYF